MATGNDIAAALLGLVDRDMTFMHICGTHEAAIARYGFTQYPALRVKDRHGPRMPVCITPQGEIDAALDLVEKDCIIATYGDLLRCPLRDLLNPAAGTVRIVQGIHKAVEIAGKTDKEVVFISVGFETTAPTVAASILTRPPENFSILSCHRVVPPAMKWLLEQGEAKLDGFVLPGHAVRSWGTRSMSSSRFRRSSPVLRPKTSCLVFSCWSNRSEKERTGSTTCTRGQSQGKET